MSKTGTTSLHAALEILGFVSCHHQHRGVRGRELIDRARAEGRPLLDYLDRYDALSDMALYDDLEELDRQYPGSRYIHTTRPVGPWVTSLVGHNQRRSRFGDRRDTGADAQMRWIAERERVERHIATFFADRPRDLLTMSIVGGDGWEVLCPFLGEPIPDVDFPRRNVAPPVGLVAGVRRRAVSTVRRLTGA